MKKIPAILLALMTFTTAVSADYEFTADDSTLYAANVQDKDLDDDAPSEDIYFDTSEDEPAPPAETETELEPEAPPASTNRPKYLIYAVESELMCTDGEIVNMYERPFVYDEITYVPFRNAVEQLGGTVDYIGETHSVNAYLGDKSYSVSLNGSEIRVINDVSFIPVRRLCESLGATVNWYGGMIGVSLGEAVTEQEAESYREPLAFTGYSDLYLYPRNVVEPRCVYTYDYMNADLALLARIYPDLIRTYSIGTSTEGRDITAFDFGKGDTRIILCGAMHAREYIASTFLMYLADTYALGYANNDSRDGYNFRELLNSVTFTIIPMVNPDGINLVQHGFDSTQNPEAVKNMPTNSYGYRGWKATVNGVDLNNNFDFLWYKKGSQPSASGYGGPYAASEPETRAMQDLINDTDFKLFTSFHSQGQVVYWMDPNCKQELANKFSPLVDRICREIGFEKMPSDGTVGASGYMTDYIRYYKETMALTIELCPYTGDYPYPENQFDIAAWPVRNIGFILGEVAKQL